MIPAGTSISYSRNNDIPQPPMSAGFVFTVIDGGGPSPDLTVATQSEASTWTETGHPDFDVKLKRA